MTTQQDHIEADFIVVGAGSAGCAVAARLSEDPATRVLLLEAGGEDRNRWIHIPLGFGKTFADPSVNWCYETEPDPGAGDRRVFWPRGKVLGGSSSINGMVYIRGQAEDFDHWRQLGNAGWSFDDVLPFFRRSEHQMRGADRFHGTGGPLCVSDVARHPICEGFIAATTGLGFPSNDDFNGASQDGVGYHQTTIRNGKRCSTAVGYLRPAMQRANLDVVTGALTEKILFEGRRAVGVTFRRHGGLCTARAAREVILCGGAVNSPQLLMLSGIGPQEHLAGFGIPSAASAYICGPASFMADMRDALTAVGLGQDAIHTELFGALPSINPGITGQARKAPHQPPGPPETGPVVTFARSGVTTAFGDDWHSVLDLADACDVPTRWSCRTGVCHTCVTPLLSGDIAYAPDPLEPPADGQVLICCATPRTDIVLDM